MLYYVLLSIVHASQYDSLGSIVVICKLYYKIWFKFFVRSEKIDAFLCMFHITVGMIWQVEVKL